jgi:nucleotidyltransferase/DNA polymerase involved in DNA repair
MAISDSANFYVSAERIFDPTLKGVPVILLSNNDGCAVARSDEAKALGIKMGEPLHLLRDKIAAHGVKVFCFQRQSKIGSKGSAKHCHFGAMIISVQTSASIRAAALII